MSASIPLIAGLGEIVARYDAIISDVWGVLHNGLRATPGASEALGAARRAGLPVVLLTNAPRPPDSIRDQLRGLGVPDDAYDRIVSSGGVTRDLIREQGDRAFYHLGPDRDSPIYEGLPARRTELARADYVLCTGLFDDETETAEDYRAMLEGARARGLPLYCANPDLIVERGDKLLPCAGALAALYETMGGEAIWVGKPHPLVYARAAAAVADLLGRPAARILAIGDALRTDIAGAAGAGHESLMVLAGIHAHEIALAGASFDRLAFDDLIGGTATRPTMTMVSLVW